MSTLEQINELFNLYETQGNNDYIGESISQREHMIQAAMLAENDKQPDVIVLASLFHDIGHLIELNDRDNLGARNHEAIGYNYLKGIGVPEPIPTLVRGHVVAKRYLVSTLETYYDKLSDASKQTFIQQGGKMSRDEIRLFENNINKDDWLVIRYYDDNAKVKNKKLKNINYYKFLLINYINKKN